MRSLLLICALMAACGGPPPPASHLRLWIETAAELEAISPPAPPHTVFASHFEQGLEGWERIVQPPREDGGLKARVADEGGHAYLSLEGTHGGLQTLFPVEPNTSYSFSGFVRTRGLQSENKPFDGARFWLAEASEEAPFEAFRTTRIELMNGSWSSPGAYSEEDWQERRRMFVTHPKTRFLHVVCSLATMHDTSAGSVDFRDLRLDAHPLEAFWLESLAAENTARAHIDPPALGDQKQRRVQSEIGGESRPALVLLPGERLRFPLPALAPGARLSFEVAPWRPTLSGGPTGKAKLRRRRPAGGNAQPARALLRLRSAERELLARTFHVKPAPREERWQHVELALVDGLTEIEFTLEGAAPMVLGTPLIRSKPAAAPRPNVILISIDTLRADHVGAYGHGGGNTPNLDALARSGLLCPDTSAPAPYTLPSHATLLTGQFPSVHGVLAHESTLSAARSTSLAEILARAGYVTRAFTAGGFVNDAFGLDQGFEAFSETDPIRERGSHYFRTQTSKLGLEHAAAMLKEQGFAAVEDWLLARDENPFFLFLHTYTVHDYDTPRRYLACAELGCSHPKVRLSTRTPEEAAAFTPEMRAHVEHLYDAALRYTDERLGQLFRLLEELQLREQTLILITSDHGEEFFEHGALQHGRTLYEELLRVPLILAGPGVAPRVLARPAMLVDVVPTLLARLHLPPPSHLQGVDLLGPDWAPRTIWSEVDSRFAHKYALRAEEGAKTIHGPPTQGIQFMNERAWEHYDLLSDPGEQFDLASPDGLDLEAARQALEKHRAALEKLGESLGTAARGEVDPETLQDLSGLGYGGG